MLVKSEDICRLQDTCILMSLIVLVITFSSTFVFQAGLITLLVRKFAATIVISAIYLFLSIALHVYSSVLCIQFMYI